MTIPVHLLIMVFLSACASAHAAEEDGGAVTARDGDALLDGWTGDSRHGGGDRGGDAWDGYIESYTFPSGSDRVRIVFDSAVGDGPRTGSVVFGEGCEPPPPTDPEVGYPPGYDWMVRPSYELMWEGFDYPIIEASVAGPRVRVRVNRASLWDEWCRLQPAVPLATGVSAYGCLPNASGGSRGENCYYIDPASGREVAVDCAKRALCMLSPVCACDATGCRSGDSGPVSFDFSVTDDRGDGRQYPQRSSHALARLGPFEERADGREVVFGAWFDVLALRNAVRRLAVEEF